MGILRSLNRKNRRKFEKLEQEEKNKIIAHDIAEKFKEVGERQIAVAFVKGVVHANEMLYEKYVTAWDAAKYEEKRKVAKQLVEEIRMHHQKYLEAQQNAENKDESKEQEEA